MRWVKPRRPEWMDSSTYDALPEAMTIRELRLRIVRKGFRTRVILIATTPTDAREYPREKLTPLGRRRWDVELDIRSLKSYLQMDVLRCRTPEMVRRESYVHMLVYNLIRGAMAEAAHAVGLSPRQLSFQGARQTLRAFASATVALSDAEFGERINLIIGMISAPLT